MKRKIRYIFIIIVLLILFIVLKNLNFINFKIVMLQKDKIKNLFELSKSKSEYKILYMLLVTFTYGFVHSMGPGHGKFFLSTYSMLSKNRAKVYLVPFLIAYTQALMAFIFVHVFINIGNKLSMLNYYSMDAKIKIISSVMMVVIGLYTLISTLLENNKKHEDEKLEIENNIKKTEATEKRKVLTMAMLIAILPCPGVMSVILFINTLGYQKYSLLFTFSTATGVFTLLMLWTVFSFNFKFNVDKLENVRVSKVLEYLSSIFLIVFAIFQII